MEAELNEVEVAVETDEGRIDCAICIRSTVDAPGLLQTPEKYFRETACGVVMCDWCREVHEANCGECRYLTPPADEAEAICT